MALSAAIGALSVPWERENWMRSAKLPKVVGIQTRMHITFPARSAGLEGLPVMDGERFQGLLTHSDVVEAYRLRSANPALRSERGST